MAKATTIDTLVPAPEGNPGRAGLLEINPPYGFKMAMQAGAALIAPPLEVAIRAG